MGAEGIGLVRGSASESGMNKRDKHSLSCKNSEKQNGHQRIAKETMRLLSYFTPQTTSFNPFIFFIFSGKL